MMKVAAYSESLRQPCLIGCGSFNHSEAIPEAERIGSKAHNLARMAALGLPVPPAFVLDTAWCAHAHRLDASLWQSALDSLAQATGQRLGDPRRPLLLSVRSGAPVSMPGMMETLLNIGLCEQTLPGLVRQTGNPRMVWDAYRRLVAGFGEVVLGLEPKVFEDDLEALCGGRDERDLDFLELRTLTRLHLDRIEQLSEVGFPQDPHAQLEAAIQAVFASWHAPKAQEYRRIHKLDEHMGTAVTVQRMVFGNAGGLSGSGVGFTRHPSTGEPLPWVDFLFNAQGEDVVSGRRTAHSHEELAEAAPAVWGELVGAIRRLEAEFCDMQDFEFTVENNRLFLLQTRNGKRTPQAAARIALDLWEEGLISNTEAQRRTQGLDAQNLSLERVVSDTGERLQPIAQGVSAAHGVAIGEVVLDEARARQRHALGASLILVRPEAETRDILSLDLAQGLLTMRGARTSHAAVVARQMGKVCLVGCEGLQIDLNRRVLRLGNLEISEGEILTLDGHTGCVYRGSVHTQTEEPKALLNRLAQLRGQAA